MAGESVAIRVLGGFEVAVDGRGVGSSGWPGRRSRELVQLLAISPGQRLPRDQVIEALWPHLDAQAGAANLRKAAYQARRVLENTDAVVLRRGQVSLFPERKVETDLAGFQQAAEAALRTADSHEARRVAQAFTGELLPDSAYEEWTFALRDRLRSTYVDVLRLAGLWTRVIEFDPSDEPAYRELMRAELAAGSRHAAIRWYGRLRTALRRELGTSPDAESEALFHQCVADLSAPEAPYFGREAELARALSVLEGARGSGPEMVVVRGPAGIGKSAFCAELAGKAASDGWTILSVAARTGGPPYAPLVAALEQFVTSDPEVLASVSERARSVLAELTRLAEPAPPLGSQLTRHQVVGAIRTALRARASEHRGVLVIVDDVHLADEATIDVVAQLGVSGWLPVRSVMAYRPEAAPPALTRSVSRLVRAGAVAEIDLEPLASDDARALAGAIASDQAAVERVVELAGGNPFLIVELAHSAIADGAESIGESLRDAIASRFVDLDGATTAMLQRLALAGEEFDPDHVIALTGMSEAGAFELLDQALAAGVLVVAGSEYRFRHELLRQVLSEQVPPHRQVAVHRDTARRLAAMGAAPAVIARHWLEGGRPDEAVSWLLAAARRALELGAFADALRSLETLLRDVPDDAEGLRLRAEALDALGDQGAPAAYATAARVAGRPAAQELRAKQALAQLKLGDPAGALHTLDGLQPRSIEGRLAEALTLSGAAALGFGDPEVGALKAAESRRLALDSGDPEAVVVASWAQAAAAHASGDLPGSLRVDLRDGSSLPSLAVSLFDGQLCITERLLYGSRPYPEVIAFADSLAAEAQRLGVARGRAFAVTLRGEARLLSGDLNDAAADLAEGRRQHQVIAAATGEALALQRQAELALHRADIDQANDLLDEALTVARESETGFHLFDRIYGAKLAASSDPIAALDEAEALVRGPSETCPGCRITFTVPAAIAAARGGEVERATQYEAATEMLAKSVMRLPAWYASLDEVRAHVALADGNSRGAKAHFKRASRTFHSAGHILDAARCQGMEESLL